jgi:hypothetical protein
MGVLAFMGAAFLGVLIDRFVLLNDDADYQSESTKKGNYYVNK